MKVVETVLTKLFVDCIGRSQYFLAFFIGAEIS